MQASGDLGNGTYRNPILAGDYADPSVVRVGDDYYMTHSSFKFAPGLLIWHSKDLVNWEPIAKALTDYAGDVWAPDLTYYEDRFYIYAPINEEIMVLTATHPHGPWSDPQKVGVQGIDPGHVADSNGNRYLFFSDGYMVELAGDGLSAVGTPRKVYDGWPFPKEWVVEGNFMESPKLTFHNGYFYLTVAQGGTSGPSTSHMVASARSKEPWGPYEHSPLNPIIRTQSRNERWCSKGHGSLVDTPDGGWWIVYHAYEKGYYTLGRQTLLEPLEWTEDGWFRVPLHCKTDEPIPKPPGDAVPHGMTYGEYQEASGGLGYPWSWYQSSNDIQYTLQKQAITIQAAPEPAPLVMMPEDHSYAAQVEIELSEESEAQLLLFYNGSTYSGFGISQEGLYGIIRGWETPSKPFPHRRVIVRLENNEHEVVFYYSADGSEWNKFEHSFETSGWHHNTLGGFLALRIALRAKGSGEVAFKNFIYQKL